MPIGILSYTPSTILSYSFHGSCQDWRPTTSRHEPGESEADDSQNPLEDVSRTLLEGDGATEFNPEFELNQIMDTLQHELPEMPLPPPAEPQRLADKNRCGSPAEATQPVPTPCRAEAPLPKVDPMDVPIFKSQKAHEDGIYPIEMRPLHPHMSICV